jgi:hypothetical protein
MELYHMQYSGSKQLQRNMEANEAQKPEHI